MKTLKLAIFGSTGSIGKNTLEVVKSLKKNNFPVEVVFLSANENISALYQQTIEFSPKYIFVNSPAKAKEFSGFSLPESTTLILSQDKLSKVIESDIYDILVVSTVGFSGLKPTIQAIKAGRRIALANKEALVVAGSFIQPLSKEFNSEIIPVDSEHSAIMQCINGENKQTVSKIYLTASGGPFREKSIKEIENANVEEALNHPNWNMGNKITIDSATMMNKGFEVIEAKWLFNLDIDSIEVLIHPQSIIHSMVEFCDGSIKAQLGLPDMKLPIQYAITYPKRIKADYPKLNFFKQNFLSFEKPDFEKFQCLKLAYYCIQEGGTYPTVLNAANEVAVDLFLKNKIKFSQLPEIIKQQLDKHINRSNYELEHIFEIDRKTRNDILNLFN